VVPATSSSSGGSVRALVAAGLALAALLGWLVVLYANVPAGYNAPYGLSLASPRLFRQLWPYPTFALEPQHFGTAAALLVLALWGAYLAAWAVARGCRPGATHRRAMFVVIGFTLLYHVALTLAMSPVLSTDIYHYALFGRMVASYGLNPYVTLGTAIGGDPLFAFAAWREVTTHYGPVWTLISAGAAALGGQDVLRTVLAFKGVAALFSLANCLLVFLLARRLGAGDGLGPLLLYAWNPLVLIETAGSGHNDAVMMTFALLGLLLAARGRLLLGLAALLLSVMVKYLTALLVLFYVVRCLTRESSRRRMAALAMRMAAVTAPLVGVLYLPFWAGPSSLERLVTVGSPFKAPARVLLRDGLAGLLANLAGVADAQALAQTCVIVGLHLGFAGLLLFLVRAALAGRTDWPRVLELWGVASLVYMGVVYGWNLPWFLVPALATTCIALRTRMSFRLLAVTHGLGLFWMLPYAMLIKV
jgi:hypothetical protein